MFRKTFRYLSQNPDILSKIGIPSSFVERTLFKVHLYKIMKKGIFTDLRIVPTYRCNQSCSYCYAKGLEKDIPQDMSIDDFKSIIHWLIKQKKNNVHFIGGEPTIHPEFTQFLDICEKNNFIVGIITNNLYSEKVAEKIKRRFVNLVMINYNYPDTYTKKNYDIFIRNLEILKNKNINILFRFNFSLENKPFDYIIEAAKKYKVSIRFGPTNPGFSECDHVGIKDIKIIKNKILEFSKECDKNDVFCCISRPVPRCLFNDKEWNSLKRRIIIKSKCYVGHGGDYTTRMVVNPDLSTFVCFGIFCNRKHLFDFSNLKEASDYYSAIFERLREKPLMNECINCKYYQSKECQGGCLSYKFTDK